jgi:hypothetical protein
MVFHALRFGHGIERNVRIVEEFGAAARQHREPVDLGC